VIPVITVEEKLKAFSKSILEKVQNESEHRLSKFIGQNEELIERERQQALKESKEIIEKARVNAESQKQQIISKARMDMKQTILRKKNEIYEKVISDIRSKAVEFTSRPEYIGLLEKFIDTGISRLNSGDIIVLIKPQDIQRYGDQLSKFALKYQSSGINVSIDKADDSILGGCICRTMDGTLRTDCSMASAIDENRELIGSILMDNL
jgi:vacuolar-type H+-ATPase subunit E/Vma4